MIICIIIGLTSYILYLNRDDQLSDTIKSTGSTFYFSKSEALTASHPIIHKRLRSSIITSFGNSDEHVKIINDTTFTVVNYVEWINREGENRRNYYCCTVTFNQDCSSKTQNLVFLEY